MAESGIEIKFIPPVGEVPEEQRAKAERQAREAYVLALLRGDIRAGRTAEPLCLNRWQLADLRSTTRSMQDELVKERKTLEKHWAKRQKQLSMVIQNITGMHGDLQGIVGPSLPRIRRLALPAA